MPMPLPKTKKGNRYVLVICDYFTKWIVAVPMKNQEAYTVAKKFVKHFVTRHGVPRMVHTDHGSNFESIVFKEICKVPMRALGVKSRMCPPYPQRDRKRRLNGAVCRNHRIKRVVPCRC